MHKLRFLQDCYRRTGWLPMQPLARELAVGDVCQLRHGRFVPLLNLAEAHLLEPLVVSTALALDAGTWRFGADVRQAFCETQWHEDGQGGHQAATKQVLEFTQAGGFAFSAASVQARLLVNWHALRDDVTLKLTQARYSFREAYVVTGVAEALDWGLVVAGEAGARLELVTALECSDRYRLLGHASARARQAHGIADFEQAQGQPGYFFKARKLVLSEAMHDHYLAQLLDNPGQLAASQVAHWLDAPLLNLARGNELNLNSSLDFFAWESLSLDDVARLGGEESVHA